MSQENQHFLLHRKINFFDLPLSVIFAIVVHGSQDKNNGFLQVSIQKDLEDQVIQSLQLMDEHFELRGVVGLVQVYGILGSQLLHPACNVSFP